MPEIGFVSIFLVGLLGGTHCVGMCGGIVGALSLQAPGGGWGLPRQLAYNLGRIASYGIAGAIAGAAGGSALLLKNLLPVQETLYLLANAMLIALGLYLAGLWQAVVYLERAGGLLWRRLQPLMGRLLPAATVPRSFLLGMVWGWLPCGLVYSALVTALASGAPLHGSLLMLAFGLGTLPNLLAMGLFAERLKAVLQHRYLRRGAGLLVAAFGAWGVLRFALA